MSDQASHLLQDIHYRPYLPSRETPPMVLSKLHKLRTNHERGLELYFRSGTWLMYFGGQRVYQGG